MTRDLNRSLVVTALILFMLFAGPSRAIAGCTGPTGNAGDINFLSGSGVMAYCNGTNWIAMGSSSSTTFGTLTTNSFCTATSSTAITCTTASTGSGNVVLSAAPTLTGTLTGASATWSGQVAIGTTTLSGALNVNGTVNATTFAGSGASLTGIGTANLSGITGTPSTSTYLRGDGTWATVSGIGIANLSGITGTPSTSTYLRGDGTWATVSGMIYPGAGIPNSTGSAWGTSYNVTGTGNVALSASPTFTGTITAANQTLSGTQSLQLGSDYTTTGSQQDVAVNASSAVRYTGAGVATFYGIAAGASGQILVLHNASSSVLTLANQSASNATASNRIITGTGSDLAVASGSSIIMQYDNTASRWRVIGGSGSGTAVAAGTTGQVQYNSGSNALAASSNMVWTSSTNQLAIGTGAATPQTTTGTVASPYVNVTPQAGTYTALSGVFGTTTINGAATGQVAYYSGANTLSGSSNLTLSGSNIALGTSSGSYLLTLDGQAARTIGVARDYTAATAGQSLTVQAGGAASGGTNLNGGNLVLTSGISTGTGTSAIQFQTSPGAAGSTTDNTLTTAMTITGAGNVGIGTTAPYDSLTVSNASSYGGGLSVATPGTGTSQQAVINLISKSDGSQLGASASNKGWQLAARGDAYTGAQDNFGLFYYNGTQWNPYLWVLPSGNVGIGTTNPSLAPLQTYNVSGATSALFGTSSTGIALQAG
jgi:hypothetical protein